MTVLHGLMVSGSDRSALQWRRDQAIDGAEALKLQHLYRAMGYKRYLKAEKGAFAVDLDKARDEERFDGMWVLRTNTELTAVEVALRYKQLPDYHSS